MFLPQNKTGTFLRQTSFFLENIDGMGRGNTVRFPNGESEIAVTPGDHRIGVGMLHGQPGTGLVTAGGEISMKIQAGKASEVMGSMVNPQQVDIWIRERSTGKEASKTISVVAIDHGLPTPMIMNMCF